MFFDVHPHSLLRLAVCASLKDMGFSKYHVHVADDLIHHHTVVYIRVEENDKAQEVVAKCTWGLRPNEVASEVRAALSALDRTYELQTQP